MIMTFEEIKANARKNYTQTPKQEFILVPPQSHNFEKPLVIIGLFVSVFFMTYGLIGG